MYIFIRYIFAYVVLDVMSWLLNSTPICFKILFDKSVLLASCSIIFNKGNNYIHIDKLSSFNLLTFCYHINIMVHLTLLQAFLFTCCRLFLYQRSFSTSCDCSTRTSMETFASCMP